MKNLLILAEQYKPRASGAEQGALNYIIENPAEIPQISIKQLSERSYTSPSTIVRLCRKLGCDGYRDVQQSILYELALREKQNARALGTNISGETADIMEGITFRNIAALESSLKIADAESLERAADIICAAKSVLLFGLGASLLVAKDAYLKFIRIDKTCACCEDIHSQYVLARNAKPTDAAVIVSYSGYTEEIVRCAEYLKAQGTPIIALTRYEASPIARLATCCLYVVAAEELHRAGAMGSRISQLNMLDILYTTCVNRNLKENSRIVSHNRIEKKDKT